MQLPGQMSAISQLANENVPTCNQYDFRPELTATDRPGKPVLAANEPAFIRADLHSMATNQH
jgi:hypothetical protein